MSSIGCINEHVGGSKCIRPHCYEKLHVSMCGHKYSTGETGVQVKEWTEVIRAFTLRTGNAKLLIQEIIFK